MSIKKEVLEAVQSSDKIKVQSVLETLINQDKSLPEFEFEQNLNYAARELSNNNIELFDEDNGDMDFNTLKENWNTDLWQTARSKLKYNFSKEKAEFIIKIMKHLRQNGNPEFQPRRGTTHANAAPNSKKKTNLKLTKTGLILGGITGGCIGLLIGHPISGSVTGGIILGGIGYLKDTKKI